MKLPRQFFAPLAIGAPAPMRELPVRLERMIHFVPPHVAKVTASEVLHVSLGERFALAVATARIWLEHEVAMARQCRVERLEGSRKNRIMSKRRSAMHVNHERISLAGLDRRRRNQHALDVIRCALPGHVRDFAGYPGQMRIRLGYRLPLARRARLDLRWHDVGLPNDG